MSAVLAANLPPAARGNVYDKAAALEFFKSAGTPETIAQGAALFVEHQHAARLGVNLDKMYLLVDGAIDILASRKPIGAVKPGEIFGEMGPLSGAARSATAIARTPCQVIGMDEAQLRRGLQVKPEFVLTLSQLMIARLRETLARLRAANAIAEDASGKQTMLFDGAILGYLRRELERTASMRFQAGQTRLGHPHVRRARRRCGGIYPAAPGRTHRTGRCARRNRTSRPVAARRQRIGGDGLHAPGNEPDHPPARTAQQA
jgi:CRP-like cAMP-binding protein